MKKAKLSVFYRGTINWTAMRADNRSMSFKDFKLYQKKCMATITDQVFSILIPNYTV